MGVPTFSEGAFCAGFFAALGAAALGAAATDTGFFTSGLAPLANIFLSLAPSTKLRVLAVSVCAFFTCSCDCCYCGFWILLFGVTGRVDSVKKKIGGES